MGRPRSGARPPRERYVRGEVLGSGTFGVVHRVFDTVLKRSVAMKVLRDRYRSMPDVLARFTDEALAMGQLQHPGIVPVYDLGWLSDGSPFYTMRIVTGQTLKQAVADGLDAATSLDAVARVADTLAFAHAHNVIHRDLKPGNVLVGDHGDIAVVDWGLARALDEGASARHRDSWVSLERPREQTLFRTATGQLAGTPAYMAPEQAAGETRASTAIDVYALGATLYHVLCGAPPYVGPSALHISAAVREGPPPPLSERVDTPVSPALEAVVLRAMSREPADRFPDAASFARALRAAL